MALAQCIRLAFSISGVYITEELEADAEFNSSIKQPKPQKREDTIKESLLSLNIKWKEQDGLITLLPNKELYNKRNFLKELGFKFNP